MIRKVLLNAVFAAACLLSIGQAQAQSSYVEFLEPKFIVNSPVSIAGAKTIRYSSDGDGAVFSSTNWGREIDSFWYNVEVVKAKDSLACANLTNPGVVNGKWALIYRGDCQFSEKAFNAQVAGAKGVIIVNNLTGNAAGMSGANNAQFVNIPVIGVSKADGDAMNARLNAGEQVFVSLTLWGFDFMHDLGFVPRSTPLSHAQTIPYSQVATGTPAAYRSYTGAYVANVGTSTETNVTVKSVVNWTPQGGSATLIRQDSVIVPTFNPLDSVIDAYKLESYNLTATGPGKFDFNYSVHADNADLQTGDNTQTHSLNISTNVFSKGRYDFATAKPTVTIGYRSGATNAPTMTWGPLYYVNKGGYKAEKVQFTVSDGDTNAHALTNYQFTNVYFYKWTDGNSNGIMTGDELTLKGIASKQFDNTDSNYKIMTVDIGDINGVPQTEATKIVVEDNSWYWVAAEVRPEFYLGCDNDMNYHNRTEAAKGASTPYAEFWAPRYPLDPGTLSANLTDSVWMIPFNFGGSIANSSNIDSVSFLDAKGVVPAIPLYIGVFPTSVNTKPTIENSTVRLYPNPATDVINVKLDLPNKTSMLYFTILNAMGQTIVREKKDAVQKGDFSFSTKSLAAGNYYMIVNIDGAAIARQFTVTK